MTHEERPTRFGLRKMAEAVLDHRSTHVASDAQVMARALVEENDRIASLELELRQAYQNLTDTQIRGNTLLAEKRALGRHIEALAKIVDSENPSAELRDAMDAALAALRAMP